MLRTIAYTLLLLSFSIMSFSPVSFAATQGAIGRSSETQLPKLVKQDDSPKPCQDEQGEIFCPK